MLTIHIVPNAHLDPAWLWDWREGLNEALDHLGRARHAARELANAAALPVGLAINTASR